MLGGMAELNHTIVHSHDKKAGAQFLAELLGLPEPVEFGPFLALQVANGVTLDYAEFGGDVASQHYAFLVSDEEFDAAFARLTERGQPYWAGPGHQGANRINTNDGGRGVYFDDPSGHVMEILTVPYGG